MIVVVLVTVLVAEEKRVRSRRRKESAGKTGGRGRRWSELTVSEDEETIVDKEED
jgi:hypothetical protein